MARERVELAKDFSMMAKALATTGSKRRGFGAKTVGPKKFKSGPVRFRTRGKGVKNAVTLVDIADRMQTLARQYAVAPPVRGNFGGGLRYRGAGGPRESYPFERSDKEPFRRKGKVSYVDRFSAEVKATGSNVWIEFENSAKTAAFVEYGTQQGDAEESAFIGAGFTKLKSSKGANKGSNYGFSVQGKFQKDFRGRYFRIPLKDSHFKQWKKDRQLTYAQKRVLGWPSVDPEYRRWKRQKAKEEAGVRVARDNPDLNARELRALRRRRGFLVRGTTGRRRERLYKAPPPPPIVRRSMARRKSTDLTSMAFVSDNLGQPYLFTRRFQPYPGYGILRRAAQDAVREILR